MMRYALELVVRRRWAWYGAVHLAARRERAGHHEVEVSSGVLVHHIHCRRPPRGDDEFVRQRRAELVVVDRRPAWQRVRVAEAPPAVWPCAEEVVVLARVDGALEAVGALVIGRRKLQRAEAIKIAASAALAAKERRSPKNRRALLRKRSLSQDL